MDRVQLRGRKRAKLRIDPHRTAGGKVVFDEEGAPMQPLELLAQDELGRSVSLWSLAACSMPLRVRWHAAGHSACRPALAGQRNSRGGP